MARFSDVITGTRQRRPAKLPLPGAHVDSQSGEWSGPVVDLEMRALRDDEYLDVLASASAYAKSKGIEKPGDGDPIYDHALSIFTLALTCVDRDSPADKPALFFDGGAEQIMKSEVMTPEVVGYLYQYQQMLQDDVSPLKKNMTPAEFLAAAVKTAQGDMSFFLNSRPGMQWSFLRTLASLHVDSLARSSASFTSSDEPPSTIPKES